MVVDAGTSRRDLVSRAPAHTWTLGADTVTAIAVVLGSLVRIVQYASNRSLWLDESALALNIIDRSSGALLGGLAFNQAAPPGFLLAEKGFTHLFGRSEYALRLFPLLCSLVALPLFAVIARRLLGRWSAALATLLFACAGGLIYYGSEVKQYSSDVAAMVVLLLLGILLYERRVRSWRTAAGCALGGFVVLFVSYAAVFPAVAICVCLAIRELAQRPRRPTPALAVAAAWGLASLLVVLFSRYTTTNVQFAFESSSTAYVGHSPHRALASLREPPSALARDLGILPIASPLYWAFVAVALLGFAGIARRRTVYAGYFFGAGCLMLIASGLHRYPIADRTVLFLVPVAVLSVAEGVAVLTAVRPRSFVWAALALAVLAVPGWRGLSHLAHPQKHEEIKPAIAMIRAGWKPGDTLYVSYPTQFALRYYLECGCIATPPWPFGRTNVDNSKQTVSLLSHLPNLVAGKAPHAAGYAAEVETLRGRSRVWLLYSHVGTGVNLADLRQILPRKLAAFGRQLHRFEAPGVLLYLYDFREP